MYQKWYGDVILGNSDRYCSVYKLQDKTEHKLIKTTLISSVSHFNSRVEVFLGVAKPTKWPRGWILGPCVASRQTCRHVSDTDNRIFRLSIYKNLGKLVMRLTGLVCTNSRNHRKTLRKIFEKHQKQKPIKIKRILITEMQANRGPIFCIFPVRGGAPLLPPSVTPLVARRPWAPRTVLEFAIKTRYVLAPWKISCCPWIFSGVLEHSWIV